MTKDLQITTNTPSIGNLEAYIQWANSIPLLTLEEEQRLGKELQEQNSVVAAQKLVTSHLRYVIKVSRGYMGYGLMLGDLIQEGSIGLMKAVKRFQPDKGVRLVSFAVHWIKAEIHEFVLKNWRIVKVATTKSQRKLFFNLRSKKGENWLTPTEIKDIATDLGVKESDVLTMEKRLHAKDSAFETPSISEDTTPSPAAYLEDKNANPLTLVEASNWDNHTKTLFTKAFSELDDRSQDILQRRWLNEKKSTLQELAKEYDISSERVRQLEKKAIEAIKASVTTETCNA